MHDLTAFFQQNLSLPEIGIASGLALLCWLCARKRRREWWIYTAFWGLAVLYVTVLRRYLFAIPQVEVTSQLPGYVLNIVLFMPFGFCLRKAAGRFLPCVAAGLGLSLLCELIQLATGCGVPDVLDLLCNTLGSTLGALAFQLLFGRRP